MIGSLMIGCTTKRKYYLSDDMLKIWNKKTMNSLDKELSSRKDSYPADRLQNQLEQTKAFLFNNTTGDFGEEEKTIRAKFLDEISKNKLRNFFVLEVVKNGEKIDIENLLILNMGNETLITSYQYFGNKWNKLKDTTINKIDLHVELMKKSPLNYRKDNGILHVILSKFSDTNITSRFYLGDMISKHDVFFELLNL